MKIESIPVDAIEVGARMRCLNEAAVNTLIESMKRLGQLQPISVFAPNNAEAHLVTGHHRLEAAKRMGWENIDAIFVNCGDIDRELQEIAENLHRAELSALERDEQIARWIDLTTAKRADAAQVDPHRKAGQQPGGINAASRELGIERKDAHRAVKVASISDEAKQAARAAGLTDNRSALLTAAKETTPAAQVAKISELALAKVNRPAVKPTKLADEPLNDFETTEKQVAGLMAAWNRAGPDAREQFLDRIDRPVMSGAYA